MAIQAVNLWIQRFVSGLATIAVCGCMAESPVGHPARHDATESESRSGPDRLEGETTVVLSGAKGELVLSQGSVLTADGAVCPNALVVLDQDFEGTARRCLFTRSDAQGNYAIRGNALARASNMVWAVTEEGQLGMSWNSVDPVTIRLLGGSIVLYVRASDGTPVENAVVTVYQGSIDDISEVVPPNLRKYVRKVTDQNGMCEFPSTLGYYDIGFQVRTPGHPDMMRDGYSSLDNNLFVIDAAAKPGKNIADTIRAEHFADLADDRRLNFGDPARLPVYLDSSTRDAQP